MEIESITEKVDTYQEPKIKNCTNCKCAYLVGGKVECHRREAEGVVVEISEDQIYLECPARDVEQYNLGGLSERYLDYVKEREYQRDLELRDKVYMNDIGGGD